MLWLLACVPNSPVVLDSETTGPVETSTPTDSVETIEENEEIPGKCPDLYDQDLFPSFSLTIAPQDWSSILSDYQNGRKDYVPAQFQYEDETAEVMVRLKGNPYFSWMGEKMQFVISFNETDPDARFHGVRKISLDASWYEPTVLRDRTTWWLLRQVEGLPSACANNATLSINGEYYGTYSNIEYYDHEWQERNFGTEGATGALWKYGTDLKTNEENGNFGPISTLWNSTQVSVLEGLGPIEQWELEWAAEAVVGDDDGYWCCAHNFYLYQHPKDGILFIPWDFDDDFDVGPYTSDPITGYADNLFGQPQFKAVVRDAKWGPIYREKVRGITALMDPEEMAQQIDTWDAQIAASVEADPHRTTGWEEHQQSVSALKGWIRNRRAYLDSWLACADGATSDADGDGYPVCDDVDDGNAAIHADAPELCDGLDNNQDGMVDNAPSCDDCERHDFNPNHFLYCRAERTWAEAETNCVAHGGHLAVPAISNEDIYSIWFHSWPQVEPWWLGATDAGHEGSWQDFSGQNVNGYWAGGEPNGGTTQNCAAWDEAQMAWTSEDCGASHPSVCRLP